MPNVSRLESKKEVEHVSDHESSERSPSNQSSQYGDSDECSFSEMEDLEHSSVAEDDVDVKSLHKDQSDQES